MNKNYKISIGKKNLRKKFKKIISYYKPYKKTFLVNLFLSILPSLIALTIPVICQFITKTAIYLEKEEAIRSTSMLTFLIVLLLLIFFFCKRYTEYQGNMFASKIEVDIKNDLFSHFQNQDFYFYDKQKIGKLMSNITNDAHNLTNIIKNTPEVLLSVLIRFIGVFAFFLTYNAFLGVVLLNAFILILIFMFVFLPKIQKMNEYLREIFSNITSDLEENLSGIKIVKSFNNEQLAINNFINNNTFYLKEKDKMYKLQSFFDSGLLTFIIGWGPIITGVGALFIINGYMKTSDVLVFILYISVLESPLWDMVKLNEFLRDGLVGLKRIINVLNSKPKVVDSKNAVSLKQINGDIEFKNVYFRYEEKNKNVFEGLNFKIHAGEYVALVGSSGVGKTTFCNLIPRFYDVSFGEILIDGINIKNIRNEDLRRNIGFVHQETFLFSGTIIENIRYGNPAASYSEIIDASVNAYTHDFIMNFPDGYNTKIGRNGINLSGGQRQRIAIARVFLRNPSILIFDEATSNLDNESEKYIQKSIENLSKTRTTIVIAHRLSTIKNAKKILVMKDGKIVEEGTHEKLLDKNGAYAELYNLL